jgi:hypothetical protein
MKLFSALKEFCKKELVTSTTHLHLVTNLDLFASIELSCVSPLFKDEGIKGFKLYSLINSLIISLKPRSSIKMSFGFRNEESPLSFDRSFLRI